MPKKRTGHRGLFYHQSRLQEWFKPALSGSCWRCRCVMRHEDGGTAFVLTELAHSLLLRLREFRP
jgi:hypothetical protein